MRSCLGGAPTKSIACAGSVFLILSVVIGACKDEIVAGSDDAGTSHDGGVTADGGACVDIALSAYPDTCTQASDCALIATGRLCNGSCGCAGSTVNKTGYADYENAVRDIKFAECPCPAELVPQCVQGACVLRTTVSDAGGSCVTVDPSSYPDSCTTATDCALIPSGKICNGSCGCGNSTVNKAGYAEYQQAVAGIEFGECGCPDEQPPQCVGGSAASWPRA